MQPGKFDIRLKSGLSLSEVPFAALHHCTAAPLHHCSPASTGRMPKKSLQLLLVCATPIPGGWLFGEPGSNALLVCFRAVLGF